MIIFDSEMFISLCLNISEFKIIFLDILKLLITSKVDTPQIKPKLWEFKCSLIAYATLIRLGFANNPLSSSSIVKFHLHFLPI